MALLPLPPARVFAELLPQAAGEGRSRGREAEPGREVHVSGCAERSAAPDRARVRLRLGSTKGAAGEARSSVSRRLDYVVHSARQRGVPDKNVTVTKDFSRVENGYKMEAEVCITFSDFEKMQNVCNLLIEKLGSSINISPPHFYHAPEAVHTLRCEVCLAAVENTRQKAQEVCQLFGQALGKPLLIREEETKEWEGQTDCHLSDSSDSLTMQQRIERSTIYASSRVFAIFEIKGKEKRKNKLI
ncbi:interleukin-1 receptor-associated kinase 1-binding protein 1 [Alligator mississippiensis]|uniref:interleukin-1 receptor-associated kinase 1-binding protein 1 n=1 Tax=Alligator mississippiensis TaxID=8496 RepID=UPI0003D09191|nr:interleukin-1 receptor-associated kinase 1-binding protein 1 [Alligator mississippiensis]